MFFFDIAFFDQLLWPHISNKILWKNQHNKNVAHKREFIWLCNKSYLLLLLSIIIMESIGFACVASFIRFIWNHSISNLWRRRKLSPQNACDCNKQHRFAGDKILLHRLQQCDNQNIEFSCCLNMYLGLNWLCFFFKLLSTERDVDKNWFFFSSFVLLIWRYRRWYLK